MPSCTSEKISGLNLCFWSLLVWLLLASSNVFADEDGVTGVYPVFIDLIDPDTGLIVDGLFAETLADSGTYFAYMAEWSVLAYRPEVWSDKLCEGCNPSATGDPIVVAGNDVGVVAGNDVGGIDFNLETITATLSGKIVDARDGITPVYPVDIDLLNSVNGDILGVSTRNNPDGSYEITDVLAGEYKVFFNAYEEAEPYFDELYDGIPCNNGDCDRSQGQVINIPGGGAVLNIDLESGKTISGTIRADNGIAIPGAAVEVFNSTGVLLSPPAISGADGDWIKPVPGDDNYFVRIQPGTVAAFQAEVWENHPCDGCDPVATGSAIQVSGSDVFGIDFYLAPASGAVTLSGKVRNSILDPIEGALVEIIDSGGNPVCCGTPADASGIWSQSLAPWADYYLRITPESIEGYIPEVWNDVSCANCDPLSKGKPIKVESESISGLNFMLAEIGSDSILSSSFESSELPLVLITPCCEPLMLAPGLDAGITVLAKYTGTKELEFNLDSGPPGMTVDPDSGRIAWVPLEGDRGLSYIVIVDATDGDLAASVQFELAVAAGEILPVSSSGSVTTVIGLGQLNGLAFDVPQPVANLGGVSQLGDDSFDIYSIETSQAPRLPSNVAALTGVFHTDPVTADEPIVITLPEIQLPDGRHFSELQIYQYTSAGSDLSVSAWVPSNGNLDLVNDKLTLEIFTSGSFMFIGLPAASSGPVTLSLSPFLPIPMDSPFINAEVVGSINCEAATYYKGGYGVVKRNWPNWTACYLDAGEDSLLVQIESLDADHWWSDQVTPEVLTSWIALSRAVTSAMGLPVRNEEKIKVYDFSNPEIDPEVVFPFDPISTLGAVAPQDDYNLIRLNSGYRNRTREVPVDAAAVTLVHEHFHETQYRAAMLVKEETQGAYFPLEKLNLEYGNPLWISEGTANWFVDEVFDSEDYLERFSTLSMFMQYGLNFDTPINGYKKWAVYKLLNQYCPDFDPIDLVAVEKKSPNDILYGDQVLDNFIDRMGLWNCNFPEGFDGEPPGSITNLLLAYNRESLRTLQNAVIFGESKDLGFRRDQLKVISAPDQEANEVKDFQPFLFDRTKASALLVEMPRNSAFSFIVSGIPGTLEPRQNLELVLYMQSNGFEQISPVKVQVASRDEPRQFATFTTETDLLDQQNLRIPIDFAGGKVPDLFVTLVNPPKADQDLGRKVVYAGLELKTDFSLDVYKQGSGSGTVTSNPVGISCDNSCTEQTAFFASDTVVTLSAVATEDSMFIRWLGIDGCDLDLVCEVILEKNQTVTALFSTKPAATRSRIISNNNYYRDIGNVAWGDIHMMYYDSVGNAIDDIPRELIESATVKLLPVDIWKDCEDGVPDCTPSLPSGTGDTAIGVDQYRVNFDTGQIDKLTVSETPQEQIFVVRKWVQTGGLGGNLSGRDALPYPALIQNPPGQLLSQFEFMDGRDDRLLISYEFAKGHIPHNQAYLEIVIKLKNGVEIYPEASYCASGYCYSGRTEWQLYAGDAVVIWEEGSLPANRYSRECTSKTTYSHNKGYYYSGDEISCLSKVVGFANFGGTFVPEANKRYLVCVNPVPVDGWTDAWTFVEGEGLCSDYGYEAP